MTTINIMTTTASELESLNLKNLQSVAKEIKVKNWWTMKKADLLKVVTDTVFGLQVEAQAKAPKKSGKKTRKAPKTEEEVQNIVTVKELASEFGIKATKARRLLRSSFGKATASDKTRWEWEKGSEELDKVRAILHDTASKKEAKA